MKQKISVLYRAKTIVGMFSPEQPIVPTEKLRIIEKGDDLFVATSAAQVRLVPENEGAAQIAELFDNDPINNASLYEASVEGDAVSVIFHRFTTPVQKLVDPSKGVLNFYFEAGLVAKEGERTGADEEALIRQVQDDCVHNDSIFIIFDKDTHAHLYVIGDQYRYRAKEERPGLFRIEGIYPVAMNIPEDQILQIYKGYRFLTFGDSLGVASVSLSQFSSASIPDMLIAWDNYIHYLSDEVKKRQKEFGLLHFKYADTSTGDIEVFFEEDVDLESEPLIKGDVELEMVSSELDAPEGNPMQKFFLGKPDRIKENKNSIVFHTNVLDKAIKKLPEIGAGYLRYSSFSVDNETRRRENAYKALSDQTNLAARNVSRFMDPEIRDTALPTGEKAVTQAVLKTMFGEASQVVLSETYRNAMDIAINTPDVALIQGPPGTGKTTLIKGVMARINAIDPLAKVLLTTEQHDALDNAVKGMKSTIPPLVASRRFDASEEEETVRLEKTIEEFKESLLERCDEILSKSREQLGHPGLEKIVYCLQRIRKADFDKQVIGEVLPELKAALTDEAIINETSADVLYLSTFATEKSTKPLFQHPLLKKINAQRVSKEAWSDDGPEKLQDLIEALEFEDHEELIFEPSLLAKLSKGPDEQTFVEYKDAVDQLRRTLFPQIGETEEQKFVSAKNALSNIQAAAIRASRETPLTVDGIIHEFRSLATDAENVLTIVKNYASIVASTCAQASKVATYSSIAGSKAKYVIVDEAARVNPLELINAIMMGIKVILVGDQMQLPQYLEEQMRAKYEKDGGSMATDYAKLLSKSLFGALYENLERAYKEGRIKARRTIRLDEQHRMNPLIGDFVSKEFYEGGIKNADNTIAKVNDFGLFNGSSLVFLDVPTVLGKEDDHGKSKIREIEIEKTLGIMAKLFAKNPSKTLEIGVLSFYKPQKELIERRALERFSAEQLAKVEFGTVDSFQGKEFDIVLISCVRSNGYDNSRQAVGFLSSAPNRINVALSRAKRLLALIGDSETLAKSENLKHYIEYAKEKGYYGAE